MKISFTSNFQIQAERQSRPDLRQLLSRQAEKNGLVKFAATPAQIAFGDTPRCVHARCEAQIRGDTQYGKEYIFKGTIWPQQGELCLDVEERSGTDELLAKLAELLANLADIAELQGLQVLIHNVVLNDGVRLGPLVAGGAMPIRENGDRIFGPRQLSERTVGRRTPGDDGENHVAGRPSAETGGRPPFSEMPRADDHPLLSRVLGLLKTDSYAKRGLAGFVLSMVAPYVKGLSETPAQRTAWYYTQHFCQGVCATAWHLDSSVSDDCREGWSRYDGMFASELRLAIRTREISDAGWYYLLKHTEDEAGRCGVRQDDWVELGKLSPIWYALLQPPSVQNEALRAIACEATGPTQKLASRLLALNLPGQDAPPNVR